MMKVKFFSDYEVSDELLKRFKANYPIKDNELDFTVNDDYNYAVVFNRAKEKIKPWAKTITVVQEPSWSDAHVDKSFLTHSDYLIIHDPELFERTHQIRLGGEIIESPSFMFFHDQVDHKIFEGTENIAKQKKISFIVSGIYSYQGNYNKRLELLHKILLSDLDIDIYGKKLELPDPRFKGMLKYKSQGLLPYEYSIAIENSNEKNYITEKFFDCAICNTTPIYNGAPNIREVYDDRYFRTIQLDSPTIIDDIKEIIAQPAPGSGINKDIYFNRFNLYTKLKEIIFSH